MREVKLTPGEVISLAKTLATTIWVEQTKALKAYAVPRGGVPAALALAGCYSAGMELVPTPEMADIIIDDIIDSGETYRHYSSKYPTKQFYALVDKPTLPADHDLKKAWVVFPWEGSSQESIEPNIVRLLQYVGEDASREGLKETPSRVAKAWRQWTSGYGKDPAALLKVFEDGADGCDEMVIVKDIPFYSKCEHHLADIFGTATVAYIPDGKIVGLSKISRLVDMYARRLQVQERLTNQIADALTQHLSPSVAVVIRARHMCMESRGICQQGHHTITSALRGVLKTSPEARAEFMSLSK